MSTPVEHKSGRFSRRGREGMFYETQIVCSQKMTFLFSQRRTGIFFRKIRKPSFKRSESFLSEHQRVLFGKTNLVFWKTRSSFPKRQEDVLPVEQKFGMCSPGRPEGIFKQTMSIGNLLVLFYFLFVSRGFPSKYLLHVCMYVNTYTSIFPRNH